VFGPTTSPFDDLGPTRWYPPPVALDSLKGVEIVLISHDHYDHLDQPTIAQMKDWDTTFVVPLGVASHLIYWGIDAERIVTLDWWQEYKKGPLTVIATPSRHASGRQVFDQMRTQWAGYALVSPTKRVFYSGDTGYFDELALIGKRFGPFDLVMIEVGAYNRAWPDWHMGPEQAVVAHQVLNGRYFLPIHWGLFDLALHGWTEPAERVVIAAKERQVKYLTPRPGELIDLDDPPAPKAWWPEVPFETAEQAAIVAT
jgi:L-ascorbate metabolism protein UlaG (beta-lactamase superfamily)